jgi:diacylglycerol kinase family enzyme
VPYIGVASLGFDSDANRIANEAKLIRGNLVYLYAALRAVAGWKPATLTVAIDGEPHEVSGWSVAVANSKAYGGGMYVAPQAELDDGRLDVLTCAATSKPYFLFRLLPRVFKGAHLDLPNISIYRAEEVSVDSDRPFDIYADGDRHRQDACHHAPAGALSQGHRPRCGSTRSPLLERVRRSRGGHLQG